MILSDVMDQLANRLKTIEGLRVYEWPAASVQVPSAQIMYPTMYEYDKTYGRGVDRMTLPLVITVGRATERAVRDLLTIYMDGGGVKSIKKVLESGTYTAFSEPRVMSVETDVYTMNGNDVWVAIFQLDIAGAGE